MPPDRMQPVLSSYYRRRCATLERLRDHASACPEAPWYTVAAGRCNLWHNTSGAVSSSTVSKCRRPASCRPLVCTGSFQIRPPGRHCRIRLHSCLSLTATARLRWSMIQGESRGIVCASVQLEVPWLFGRSLRRQPTIHREPAKQVPPTSPRLRLRRSQLTTRSPSAHMGASKREDAPTDSICRIGSTPSVSWRIPSQKANKNSLRTAQIRPDDRA